MNSPTAAAAANTPAARTRPQALVFDIFGTVVDWRSSLIREGQALQQRLTSKAPDRAADLAVDWPAFADAWRAGYQPAMQRVARGELPWTNIDALHRMILNELLPRFGLEVLTEEERDHLNRAWHRLDPWPDSRAGLTRLRRRHVLSTLSNGNLALLVNMAKRAGLPWDCILSAEIMGRYKPDLEVYRSAARLLGFTPAQVLMVAAHPSDLMAAQQAGLMTAYIPRPLERGEGGWMEPTEGCRFDWVARDMIDLADQLQA